MRLGWLPLLATLVSCRAACGLDELEGAGGAGAGGGSTSTDAATTSSGAAGGGGASTSSTSGAGGGCEADGECLHCADEFLDTEPVACLVVDGGCIDSGGGGGCAGSFSIDQGVLSIMPDAPSGFWDLGWPAVYLHTISTVPGGQPFIARTLVETLAGGGTGWPGLEFQLAGIVVSTTTGAERASDWFKAEYGTLAAAASRGLRTVRRSPLNTSPLPATGDERIGDELDPGAAGNTSPTWVEIAVCRTNDRRLWAFYKPVNATVWSQVSPTQNPVFTEPAYVGLVAAAGSSNADLLARFGFFELRTLSDLPNPSVCESWLEAHALPPAQ